ncbi:MAG: hypothetical protein U0263_12270 [Polyangiaceae bacterium]
MKRIFGAFTLALMGATLVSASGCKLVCKENEQKNGSECIGKSLTKFNGTEVSKTVDYQPGGTFSVSATYGNIKIQSGAPAGKVVVVFQPFDYEGYDEKDLATRQMNENLSLNVAEGANVNITAQRTGETTNGLGTSIVVQLPPEFDSSITIVNDGKGPLNEFDVDVSGVGASKSVNLTNHSDLGKCTVSGAASVVNTNVTCHREVTVTGVSDDVNISTEGAGMDDPSVVVRIASISGSAKGGTIEVTDQGSIDATFPASGDFSVHGSAPKGAVDVGAPPASCTATETSSVDKTVACGGGGPSYTVRTAGENGTVFLEGNVKLSYK